MNLRPFPYLNYILVAVAVSIFSCNEFIEPSIEKKQIQVNAPANNHQSSSYLVSFWWDEVDNALQYHLQIVTPGFDSVSHLVMDTVVKSNKVAFSLEPGQYQWRVRAENGSTQTAYSSARNLNILFSSIKQQKVQLFSPTNNTLTNQASTLFQWSNMYGATKYRLQVDTNNFVNTSQLYYDQTAPAQQISVALSKDQSYQWRVRAENDTAQSQWSAIYTTSIDRTPPAKVTLLSPANGQTGNLPQTLQWNQSATATKYRLYVYKADGATPYSPAYPLTVNTTSHSFNAGTSGETIYWKVTAIDAAGNESIASELRNFILF